MSPAPRVQPGRGLFSFSCALASPVDHCVCSCKGESTLQDKHELQRGLAQTYLHRSRGGSRRGSRCAKRSGHGSRAGGGERGQRSLPREEHHAQTSHAPSALQLHPRLRLLKPCTGFETRQPLISLVTPGAVPPRVDRCAVPAAIQGLRSHRSFQTSERRGMNRLPYTRCGTTWCWRCETPRLQSQKMGVVSKPRGPFSGVRCAAFFVAVGKHCQVRLPSARTCTDLCPRIVHVRGPLAPPLTTRQQRRA